LLTSEAHLSNLYLLSTSSPPPSIPPHAFPAPPLPPPPYLRASLRPPPRRRHPWRPVAFVAGGAGVRGGGERAGDGGAAGGGPWQRRRTSFSPPSSPSLSSSASPAGHPYLLAASMAAVPWSRKAAPPLLCSLRQRARWARSCWRADPGARSRQCSLLLLRRVAGWSSTAGDTFLGKRGGPLPLLRVATVPMAATALRASVHRPRHTLPSSL